MHDSDTTSPSRTIAIGDVHGCARALAAVLEAIVPRPTDQLVTLGDYVDRGDDSRGVLRQLIDLGKRCQLVSLLGNHEEMMLNALSVSQDEPFPDELEFWLRCGGRETIESYGGPDQIPPSHLDFLRACRAYHETDTHIFVHANYDAHLPLDEQDVYMLRWCHLHGVTPEPHISGKTVVVGHTPQANGEVLHLGHVIGIDTYCVGGKWLTAFDVDQGTVWQADREGRLRTS